jgi:hypothetical protein
MMPLKNVILNCYRLAREYSCNPDIFLRQPMTVIGRHLEWTERLNNSEAVELEWAKRVRDG